MLSFANIRYRAVSLTAVLLAGQIIGGCSESPAPVDTNASAPASSPAANTGSASNPTDIARQTVATFLQLPLDEVTPVITESKSFGDASLGCPQAGMSYAQVVTPGHQVIVEADGRRFDVRVAGGAGRICRQPRGGPGIKEIESKRPGEPGSATR